MFLRHWAMTSFCFALGCTSSESPEGVATTIDGCMDQFAASKGYGYRNDPGTATAATAPTGTAGASMAQTTPISPLERALAECQAGDTETSQVDSPDGGAVSDSGIPGSTPQPGTNCEFARLLTHDAAVCIARARGLSEELGYAAAILYLAEKRRIVWVVRNTTESRSNEQGGVTMMLDATTGALLETGTWSAMA